MVRHMLDTPAAYLLTPLYCGPSVFLQRLNYCSLPDYITPKLKAGTQVFIHQCSMQVYSKYPKGRTNPCPSTDEWINKMCYIHAVEYYSTIKRNEVLTCFNMGKP
jgi:hypothetical protein